MEIHLQNDGMQYFELHHLAQEKSHHKSAGYITTLESHFLSASVVYDLTFPHLSSDHPS